MPKRLHRAIFQGQLKKCLKVIDLKSGTKRLQHWTTSQPWLNMIGCDSLNWVCLDCDREVKTILSLSSNSSVTEISQWQDHPSGLTSQFLDFYIALHIAGKEYMEMGGFFKGNWWLVQLYRGKCGRGMHRTLQIWYWWGRSGVFHFSPSAGTDSWRRKREGLYSGSGTLSTHPALVW